MWRKYNFLHPSWIVVIVAVGVVAWAVVAAFSTSPQEAWAGLVGETVELSGEVVEDPDTSESKTTLRLNNLKMLVTGNGGAEKSDENEGQMVPVNGAVFLSLRVNREIMRGDSLTVRGKLSEGFGSFAATMYRPSVVRLERPEPGDMFLAARDFMAGKIREQLPEAEAALGLGYLLGVRSSLPEGLAETLKVVGLTHIIVASGANLSILISFARKLFGKISRFFGLAVSMSLTGFYVGMVGLSPSMVRAGLVASLSLITWYVGRRFEAWRLLLIVAAMTLIYNPMYVIDLGWLLSFGSFAGIMILGPRLTQFFYGAEKPGAIGATLLETVSASLLCVPILLYFFGTTSLISLLANLLILPTIAPAMALTFATGVLGVLGVPWLPVVLGKITTLLLSFHLAVINFLGGQEIFLIEIPAEQPAVFLLYAPIVLIAVKNHIKIGKGNRGHEDGAFEIVDGGKNFPRELVQRQKVTDGIGDQDGKEGGDQASLKDAKQAKQPATARLEIEYHRHAED